LDRADNLSRYQIALIEEHFMSNSPPEVTLPNGIKINYINKREVPTVFDSIQEYLKNGIEVHEQDIIFDIGANIGIFALWISQKCNRNITIFSFEPIPKIFKILQRNLHRFDSNNLHAFNFGLSNECKELTFSFRPNSTVISTAYPDGWYEDLQKMKDTITFQDKTLQLPWRVLGLFPKFIRSFLLDLLFNWVLQTEEVVCQVQTVSDFISEQDIKQIDLLKVDVEKGELDVLMGIEQRDWPKIKQVVVEVHDSDNRVEVIKTLLKRHGFKKITMNQESIFKDINIFNVYALRESE